MRRRRAGRGGRAPRPLATAVPVLLAALALPSIERTLHPAVVPAEPGPRIREIVDATSPLERSGSAEEVFDWLRSIERIPFDRTVELRLDVESPDPVAPRLRATVAAVADMPFREEQR